ncbi:MAG: L-threonylcarbamoyladenylate synthase [bacterium]
MNNILIFPTDTVYGMGASITDIASLKDIFVIKNRELNKRLAVLCYDLEQIKQIAYVTDDAIKLINKYLPGGLSIILKTKESYISELIGDTIAVRIPNHELALSLLKEIGPMATTSVNVSSEPPINDYNEIKKIYDGKVKKIYNNDKDLDGVSSTVINLTTKEVTLIREGNISFEEILKTMNN